MRQGFSWGFRDVYMQRTKICTTSKQARKKGCNFVALSALMVCESNDLEVAMQIVLRPWRSIKKTCN